MTKDEIRKMNTTTLAYLGDAVFEVIVREKIVTEKPGDVGRAHHTAVRYVSASGQAKAAKAMIAEGFLTDEEERIYKQARNHRSMSRPQNADPREYKIATGSRHCWDIFIWQTTGRGSARSRPRQSA